MALVMARLLVPVGNCSRAVGSRRGPGETLSKRETDPGVT